MAVNGQSIYGREPALGGRRGGQQSQTVTVHIKQSAITTRAIGYFQPQWPSLDISIKGFSYDCRIGPQITSFLRFGCLAREIRESCDHR